MGFSTAKTNCDRDQDFLTHRDQLFNTVKIFSTVKKSFYAISLEIFKLRLFQSRLGWVKILVGAVKIVKTNWDCWDLSRLFEICWEILTLLKLFKRFQAQKFQQIYKSWLRKMLKFMHSWSRSRKLSRFNKNFRSQQFFNLRWDFLNWTVVSR